METRKSNQELKRGDDQNTNRNDSPGAPYPDTPSLSDAGIKSKLDELAELLKKQSPDRVDLALSELTEGMEATPGNDDETNDGATGGQRESGD